VLGRPAPSRARAVVVRPDDLVEKAVAAEDLVEQQLAVVGLAIVDVEVQRALATEQPAGVFQARSEEREIVVKRVAVGGLGEQARAVAAPLKARPVTVRIGRCAQRLTGLRLARVERRVDVDQLERCVGEASQQIEVVAEQDLVHVGMARSRAHPRKRTRPGQSPLPIQSSLA
jgi:hypothetical protein